MSTMRPHRQRWSGSDTVSDVPGVAPVYPVEYALILFCHAEHMRIEVFEMQGINEMATDLDALIINLHKKYNKTIDIRKINVVDKNAMKDHKDVIGMLRDKGLDVLPLIKKDGKLVTEEKLGQLLQQLR